MIGFAGLSHLGIVSALAAAAKGCEVVAYHPDSGLVARLKDGALPLFEPGLADLLDQHRERIQFTSEATPLRACELVYISLDVATDNQDRCQLSDLDRLVCEVAAEMQDRSTLVVLSQVPPGTTRRALSMIHGGGDISPLNVFCQVETLILGKAVERALHPHRIIVGCDDPASPLPSAYKSFLDRFRCPILPMCFESAELAKIAINTYLAAAVGVANTLSELCEAIGADWREVVTALRLDPRIGPSAYLDPGLGIGGGNLERDLVTTQTLAEALGTHHALLDACLVNSNYRSHWALRSMYSAVLSQCHDPRVGVWGLAYKADTACTKNSPAVEFIRALRPFSVVAYDPQARIDAAELPHCVQVDSPLSACQNVDVLAVMTPWPIFRAVDITSVRDAMRGRVILDPFGLLDATATTDTELHYFRLGSDGRGRRRQYGNA